MEIIPAGSARPEASKQKGFSMHTWAAPYSVLQADHIIWKYKKVFPNEVLPDRIKLWPTTLAESVQEKHTMIDLAKLKDAGERHQHERQHILHEMKNILIQHKHLSNLSPLQKLEIYEDMRFRTFQAEIGKNTYRFVRKYFSWLLPKRIYKRKKKTKAQIQRRHEKKKLAKSTHTLGVSPDAGGKMPDATDNSEPQPWWKNWHPVQPHVVDAPKTYAESGNPARFGRKRK